MSGAYLSGERVPVYRYQLWRYLPGALDARPPTLQDSLAFIMLNPSTADATADDPTVRRCEGFARRFGYVRFDVFNLFAFRATDPSQLSKVGYGAARGPMNGAFLGEAMKNAGCVVAAWGTRGAIHGQDRHTLLQALAHKCEVYHLGPLTKGGFPRHPLYLPKDAELHRMELDA